jgi:hypothetical protein
MRWDVTVDTTDMEETRWRHDVGVIEFATAQSTEEGNGDWKSDNKIKVKRWRNLRISVQEIADITRVVGAKWMGCVAAMTYAAEGSNGNI